MAGARSLRATHQRICCSQISRRPRESGCSPRLPTRYGDGGGSTWYGGYAMVPRGILLGLSAEQSKRAGAAPLGGGGVLCRHARVHDYGRSLPEHPSGVALPLGPVPGRAGPGPPQGGGGGGGTSLHPLGSGRGAPPPFPIAHTARAAARRVRSTPAPCAPRASLPLGRHWQPSPPPFAPSLPWGGGAPSRAAPGRVGGGLLAPRPAAGPHPRRGRLVLRAPIRTPALLLPPRRPRWSLPPRRWPSEALAEAQAGSRAGTSRCIRCESHVVRGAVCGRHRPPSEEADGAFWCPLRLGQPCACWAAPRACRAGRGGLCWGRCVATRGGGEVMAGRRCAAPLVPAAGLLWGRALHLRSQP